MIKKESNMNLILISLLSFVLGVILIAATEDILTVFNYIFVCVFGIIGIIELIGFGVLKGYRENDYSNLLMGIVFVWLALIMYVYYMMIINILPIIFSLYLFIMGAFMLMWYFLEKNTMKRKYKRYLVLGILSIIVGVLLIFEPGFGVYTYLKITGVNVIFIACLFFYEFFNNLRKKNG